MKLSRKNITMQVLSKFIENNLEKIENVEKAVVFTREELKKHYELEAKKKKNGEVDFEMYTHFIGRLCIDARVRSDKDAIDITKYVNNYIF